MRICKILCDFQEHGGLEEIATTLATNVQQHGHDVSVLSTAWVSPANQYAQRLQENHIQLIHLPRWLSHLVSNWYTKEKILKIVIRLCTPLIYLMGAALFVLRSQPWHQAQKSAKGWLNGKLMRYVIGPDRRKLFVRLLLNWWCLRWRPDLIHVHGFTTDISSLFFVVEWANVKKIPLIYEEHQTLDEQFGLWREFRRSVNQATAVVAVSEKSAEALRTVGKTTQPIVVMTPSVVDPIASGWLDSIDVRYRPGPLVATTIARLSEAKGLTYLLEAIAQLRSTYPQVSFHVRGDGAMREELLAQANRLGLNGDEIFVGPFVREQLPRIMEQTDIFVMSSISEGQPLAIVEAMAFGRPIVTTAVGGIPEMIQHGRNGLLCEACNPTDLVDKISQLLENPRLRMELGRAARRSFEEGPFEPVYVCRKFISLYGQTIAMATNPKPASLVSERITY